MIVKGAGGVFMEIIIVCIVLLLLEARKVARGTGQSLRWQGIMTVVLTATVYSISFLPFTVYSRAAPFIMKDHSIWNSTG